MRSFLLSAFLSGWCCFLLNGKSIILLRLKKEPFRFTVSCTSTLTMYDNDNDLSCLSWKICHYPVFFEGTNSIFPETWALSLSRCKKLSCCAQISNRSLKLSWEEDPDALVMLACLTQRRVIWRRASSQSDNRSVLYLPLLAPLALPPLALICGPQRKCRRHCRAWRHTSISGQSPHNLLRSPSHSLLFCSD